MDFTNQYHTQYLSNVVNKKNKQPNVVKLKDKQRHILKQQTEDTLRNKFIQEKIENDKRFKISQNNNFFLNQPTYNPPSNNNNYNEQNYIYQSNNYVPQQPTYNTQPRQIYEQPKIKVHNEQNYSKFQERYNKNPYQKPNTETNYKKEYKNQLEDFINQGFNPYDILGLEDEFTFHDVKKAYKKLALKTHPDKGGNAHLFEMVTKAYMYILEEFKKQKTSKDYNELKNESKQNIEQQKTYVNTNLERDGFNVNKFNRIYSDNKLKDVYDDGYGEWMDKRTDEREDIDIENIFSDKFNINIFNSTFDEDKNTDVDNLQLIEIIEPSPMQLSNRLKFTTLGDKKINDFSKNYNVNNVNSLDYSDYKKAHTQTKLINVNKYKSRKSYRNITDFKHSRKNQKMTLNEKEKEYFSTKKEKEYLEEQKRLHRLKQKDILIEKHFKKMNKLMIQ